MPGLINRNGLFDGLLEDGLIINGIIEAPLLPVIINTVAPVATGTGQVGQLLSTTNGSWDVLPDSYTYQWYRGTSPIGGATASTYTIVAADVGNTVKCKVTAIKTGYTNGSADSNGISVPVLANTVAPVISGATIGIGETLSTTNGTWNLTPDSYTYQWYRGASPIGGATASTYVLTGADDGTTITCQVTAVKAGYTSATEPSNGIALVFLSNTVAPVATGAGYTGQTLSTTNGTWSLTPDSYTYQWYSNSSPISGATSSTYLVTTATEGTVLHCEVTAIKSGYTSATDDSNAIHSWLPSDMTTSAWFDASDSGSITESGGSVSQWNDKSGNARHLTQATGSKQPTYVSSQYLSFDGTDDELTGAGKGLAGDFVTGFGVVRVNTDLTGDSSRSWLHEIGGTSNGNYWFSARGDIDNLGFTTVDTSGDFESGSQTAARDEDHLVTGTSQLAGSEKMQFRANGDTPSYSTNQQSFNLQKGTSPELTIGRQKNVSTRYHNGRVYEVILLNIRLKETDANFLKIEGYLAHKWGLTAKLPSGHAYKTTAPTA